MGGRPETSSGRGGQWRRRLLAFGVSLAVALAAAELVARATFGTPLRERLPVLEIRANAHRGWEMVPEELHYTYLHPVRVNALGLRGPEVPPRSGGEAEVRVLALGDSLVYGQGVADDETVPAYLEAELAARDPEGRRFRVVNAGHRAYDTNQELGLLRELGPVIEPDVVVLFWFWNDIQAVDVEGVHHRISASGPVAFDTKQPMEGAARLRWHLVQCLRRSALVMATVDLWRDRGAEPPSEEFVAAGLRRLERQLQELVRLCAELDAAPLVCAIPDPSAVVGAHFSRAIAERAVQLAEEGGIPALLLRDAVSRAAEEAGRLPVLPYDGHYAPPANAAMARAAAEHLLAHLPPPG